MKHLRSVFAESMLETGLYNPRLVVMVGDISHGILQPFAKACPGRFYNIGICEPTIVNMAAGIAKSGLIPVVHTIAPFIIERAYEQIKLDFGYQNLSGNFISVGSAFDYAQLGCSHHCYADIPLMLQFARSQIFFPSSPIEFSVLFKKAYQAPFVNYFRLPDKSHSVVFDESDIEIGQAIRVTEGSDLTIVVIGPQLANALSTQKILKDQGIDCEILYFPTIWPFDSQAVFSSVQKTKKVLVIEEVFQRGGVYSLVLDAVKSIPHVDYSSIAVKDFIHSYGTYEELCEEQGFSVKGILKKISEDFPQFKQSQFLSKYFTGEETTV